MSPSLISGRLRRPRKGRNFASEITGALYFASQAKLRRAPYFRGSTGLRRGTDILVKSPRGGEFGQGNSALTPKSRDLDFDSREGQGWSHQLVDLPRAKASPPRP